MLSAGKVGCYISSLPLDLFAAYLALSESAQFPNAVVSSITKHAWQLGDSRISVTDV